jgi:hypothetical protein
VNVFFGVLQVRQLPFLRVILNPHKKQILLSMAGRTDPYATEKSEQDNCLDVKKSRHEVH